MNDDSISVPAEPADDATPLPFEAFFVSIFGNGRTTGDVSVCREDNEVLTSRDLDAIADFVGTDNTVVSLRTATQEQPAVAAYYDRAEDVPLSPSVLLRHVAGDVCAVWCLTDAGTLYAEGAECPLAGVGGWSIAEEHLGRVYDLEAVRAALMPVAPALPDGVTAKINDMVILGELDPAILAREIEIGISPFGAKTMSGRWKNWKTTVGGMLQRFTKHEQGEKDGNCFLQGATIDGERRAAAIPSMDLLGLDLDTGENLDEIRARIQALGLFAWIYTTHSHLKPITSIKKDEVVKWLGGVENPDIDGVKSYLIEKKRYRPYILEGAKLLDSKHTAEGVQMFVQHQPMPKFRVVFVLERRFVVMDRPGTQSQALTEWKERYAGASKMLEAFFDRACTDPSRLFYTPRHPKDAREYRIEVIAGKPLDIDTVDRVTSEELKRGSMSPFDQAAADMAGGKQYKTSSLLWFFGKYGDRFDIETFLLEQDPDGDRGSRPRGGRIHRCPNDDAHSDAGNPEDQGFYCVNPDQAENGVATAGCRHDSCSGLDRVDFTDMICERVGITDATELKKWVPETVEDDESERGTPKADDWTRADDFEAMCEGFHKVAGFVAVGESGKYVRLDPDGHNVSFTGLRAFERLHDHVRLPITDKKSGATSLVPFLKLWSGSTQSAQRKFHGLTFQPNRTPDQVFPLFNVWRSLGVQPVKGDWSLIRRHIWEVLANEDQAKFDMILGWMARHLQCLGDLDRKFPLSLVVKGEEGVGKSIVFDAYRQIFGRHGVTLSTPEDVLGEFNAHLAEAVFVLMEEAFFAGDPRIKGPLKHMLTGKDMLLQYKGIDKKTVPNYAQYIIVSNEELPVPIEPGSRRFYVVEASDRYKDKTSYFTALLAQIRQGGVAAMAHDLLEYEPPGDDWSFLYRSHHTIESDVMLARKLKPFERFMIRHVQEAVSGDTQEKRFGNPFAVSEDQTSEWNLDEIRSAFVDSPELEDAPRHMRVDRDTDKTRLGEQLSAMLPSVGKRKSHGKIVRVFPPRAEMVTDLQRHKHRGYGAFLAMLESGEE